VLVDKLLAIRLIKDYLSVIKTQIRLESLDRGISI
jgi:hypothetical protein